MKGGDEFVFELEELLLIMLGLSDPLREPLCQSKAPGRLLVFLSRLEPLFDLVGLSLMDSSLESM